MARVYDIMHGHTVGGIQSRTYVAWRNMRRRCTESRCLRFHRYGGRGIKVCERWLVFENFLADMGEVPLGMSLDRKDNDKDYEPSNCRWATPKQQARKTSRTLWITHAGETRSLAEWAEITGIPRTTITHRLRHGLLAEQALRRS